MNVFLSTMTVERTICVLGSFVWPYAVWHLARMKEPFLLLAFFAVVAWAVTAHWIYTMAKAAHKICQR